MFFENVQQGPPDPMYHLKVAADRDHDPKKVDLGVGVYRNEAGHYHELQALKEAKKALVATNPGHDYEVTTGSASFLQKAATVVFGKDSEQLKSGKVASVQTISGTGAVHMGAMFLKKSVPGMNQSIYIGTPAWGNYQPLFKLAGLDAHTYNYYDSKKGDVDFHSLLSTIRGASKGSTFVLQACCNNPTAVDLSKEQWKIIGKEFKERDLFPFFDIAYQGLGNGLDQDAYGVRHFVDLGLEMIVCQSFSKNFGLYGERVGVLHVVGSSKEVAATVGDQLRCLIRWEFSSSPAYGSRLVDIILSDTKSEDKWEAELETIRHRLQNIRKELLQLLTETYKTPGDWSLISRGNGLFSFLPLTPAQCHDLQTQFHIYLTSQGRINISGLCKDNIDYVACAIDSAARNA
ncbi:Fc.00g058380.m01.CDS01 [Cosmosporella sp. VM-42]